MAYEIGKWTNSVLELLRFIEEQTKSGNHPRLKDLKKGTYRNWIYPLKKAGYVGFEHGFFLTDLGKALLDKLTANPPSVKRERKRENYSPQKTQEQRPTQDLSEVTIRGTETVYQSLVDKRQANEIIRFIAELKNKK